MFALLSLLLLVSSSFGLSLTSTRIGRSTRLEPLSMSLFSFPSSSSLALAQGSVVPIVDVVNRLLLSSSLPLCETSISEEEVLDVTGRVSDLPDPMIAVSFAVFVFIGVGVLQFTLGDLTKEEGQARVRDFLQTRKDTERKRGYFD